MEELGQTETEPNILGRVPSDPPGGNPEQPDELARLPHGRHGLPPEFVERNQRRRLLASLIQVVAESGYDAATITNVAEGAGVTTRAFYKYFDTVEDSYLAAFDAAAELLSERLREAWAGGGKWPEQVHSALAAALDFFAASPQLARILLTEPFVAGADAAARYQDGVGRLAAYLREGRNLADEGAGIPETAERGLVGSIASQIGRKAAAGDGDLTSLLPDLTQFALTPYLGAAEARKVARSKR